MSYGVFPRPMWTAASEGSTVTESVWLVHSWCLAVHYDDIIMGAIAPLITSLTIVYSSVYSDADQSKHQSSASLAFVWGIHRVPVNSPHKWPVTRKMFPFADVIMYMQPTNSERHSHATELYGVYCLLTYWGRDNGRHFPDDIFKCIFLNENVLISIKISLKFVPKGQINNIQFLV